MTLALLASASLMIGGSAWAKCKKADLKGTWSVYITDLDEEDPPGWGKCKFVITKGGNLNVKKSSCKSQRGTTYDFSNGKFTVRNKCKVTATLDLEGEGTLKIDEAWLAKGKQVMSGVGYDEDSEGGDPEEDVFTFTAIKR
jgi:hypothetical protein